MRCSSAAIARVRRVTPVIYRHTADAFFKQVLARRGLLTPDFLAKLSALGIDPNKPRDVEMATWWKVMAATAELLAPGASVEDAHREAGREVVRGFEQSLVGKTSFMVLRMLGHRRAFTKLAESFNGADTATKVEVLEATPTGARVRFTIAGGHPQPAYTEGILLEGLEMIGAKGTTVRHQREAAGSVLFELSWT